MWNRSTVVRRAVACAVLALMAFAGGHSRVHAAPRTFKLAFFNIMGGTGQVGLTGAPVLFTKTANCTDPTMPLNAWGVGFVQSELLDQIASDPGIVALGLAEAWACATPEKVRKALGWPAMVAAPESLAVVARYGFAGEAQWLQLDTSRNETPADTKWVGRVPVCLDAACSASVLMYAAHWGASFAQSAGLAPASWYTTYDIQAAQTIDFLAERPASEPAVLIGDLNTWEGSSVVCEQFPTNRPMRALRAQGYVDAWRALNGLAEGYTGMWDRAGCGTPVGYVWKRIDQAWSRSLAPVSMRRFGMVTPGEAAPSDHAGVVVEYPAPAALAGTIPPAVGVTSPTDNASVAATAAVQISASDDLGIRRVELLVDGVTIAVDSAAPFQFSWDTTRISNGSHALTAAATDTSGNRSLSAPRTVRVENPVEAGDEIVLHGAEGDITGSAWQFTADSSAASGIRLQNANAGAPPPAYALSSPPAYVEFTFTANAGRPYRLWIRGRALGDSPDNDSLFVQFSGSVTASGAPAYRIGTNAAARVILDECVGCGLSGWGWRDNGWPQEVIGTPIYFATTGPQRLRIQAQEDGIGIDQVVLSAVNYRWKSPGRPTSDTTILRATSTGGPVTPPSTTPPTVTMTSPASGSTFAAPASIQLGANAADADGTVARVDFYAGTTLVGSDTTSPYSVTWNAATAGNYSLTARAIDNSGTATVSAAVFVAVTATAALPAPWNQQDIGAVGHAGSASVANGVWTVTGGGTDVWSTSDQFHFVYQPLTGDGEVIARVATLQSVNDWTKAGVMIRASLASGSMDAFMLVTPSGAKGLAFQRRTATGGLTTNTAGGSGVPPAWLRLKRAGTTITAYRSVDGVQWTAVGSDTLATTAVVEVGLAVTSHDNARTATATFDHVRVTTTSSAAAAADVVLYAAQASTAVNWQAVADSTAAGGARLQNTNQDAPKITVAAAQPASYFELTFTALQGQPYRLWIRGKATSNSPENDSVHVQFDDSVTAVGAAAYRIGTTGSVEYNLEECTGCGLSSWGWQDNGWGNPGLLGPAIYFNHDGVQTMRIQVREDGLGIDQIVLSSQKWLSTAPGAAKGDVTILSKTN